MSDLVERLRERALAARSENTGTGIGDAIHFEEAADEIERLTAAMKYEQHRAGRIGTHSQECHAWGPQHYECLLLEYRRLTAALAVAETTAWNAAIDAANNCCENCVITADNDYEQAYDDGVIACIDAIRALRKDAP